MLAVTTGRRMPEINFKSDFANRQESEAANQGAVDESRVAGRRRFGGSAPPDSVAHRWVLTSDEWISQDRALMLHVGPSEAQWTFPLRASEVETSTGKVRFSSKRVTEHSSTRFDLPTVSLSFQGGNAMPIYDTSRPASVSLPDGRVLSAQPGVAEEPIAMADGLQDFYLFLELIGQAPRIAQPGSLRGRMNHTWIFYTSTKFPAIVLRGFFSPGGPTMTDSAEDVSGLTWSHEFVVHDSSPEIGKARLMMSQWRAAMLRKTAFGAATNPFSFNG